MEAGEQKLDQGDFLVDEEVLDAEVREILTRLSAADLGGPELATIGAICEVTGATPIVVGRMLAAIRQENLDERFGRQLKDHDRQIKNQASRLDDHDVEIVQLKSALPAGSPYDQYEDEVDEELVRMAQERVQARQLRPYLIVSLILVAIIVFIAMSSRQSAIPPDSLPPLPFDAR